MLAGGPTISRWCAFKAASIIGAHQARVARDIGCENGSKPAFDPRLGHVMCLGARVITEQVYGPKPGCIHHIRNDRFGSIATRAT